MVATSTGLSNLPQQMIALIPAAIEEGNKQAARMLWGILQNFLLEHWFLSVGIFFLLFSIATLKAVLGRWGSLGSLLYNFLYFSSLYLAGLIWGPEIFVNDFFNAVCAAILYPSCYLLVRYILNKAGLRRRF